MDLKKIGKAVCFPPIAVLIILIPLATALLVYSMVFLETKTIVAYVSYAFATYTLVISCCRIPALVRFFKNLKDKNEFVKRWQNDTGLRVNVSLYAALFINVIYSIFWLGLGIKHHTFWFYSLAFYYISLAAMRLFLVYYTGRNKMGSDIRKELYRYLICGIVFLIMNISLALMIFFMVYWDRTFHHHEITTIAMAAYTFTSLIRAIINIVKYRRYNSPVYSASKAISLAAAGVSMLTLESTMLTTFNDGTMTLTERRILLGASGSVISIFIIGMAIFMIVQGSRKIKQLNIKEQTYG